MTVSPSIELTEYAPKVVNREDFSVELARELLHYKDQVEFEEPGIRTDEKWRLTAKHWVGHIPLSRDVGLVIRPRTPVSNLFRMLEYAYDLSGFHLLRGEFEAKEIKDVYERLAVILAERIALRVRQGLQRDYFSLVEKTPVVRGRLDTRQLSVRPWQVEKTCEVQSHSADVEENQILLWTLLNVLRSGLCGLATSRKVEAVYRSLRGHVSPNPIPVERLTALTYTRLNHDYAQMHALCRFFLEHTGPSHEVGDYKMLPFLVDTAELFEKFVYHWLDKHLPQRYQVRRQERFWLDKESKYSLVVDLVLRDLKEGIDLCVLDTKYKQAAKPSAQDISQVHTYACLQGVTAAFLVYPEPPEQRLDVEIDGVKVRSATFDIRGNLEAAGKDFLKSVGIFAT